MQLPHTIKALLQSTWFTTVYKSYTWNYEGNDIINIVLKTSYLPWNLSKTSLNEQTTAIYCIRYVVSGYMYKPLQEKCLRFQSS